MRSSSRAKPRTFAWTYVFCLAFGFCLLDASAGLQLSWSVSPTGTLALGDTCSATVSANFVPPAPVEQDETVTATNITYAYSWSVQDGSVVDGAGDSATEGVRFTGTGLKAVVVTVTAQGTYTVHQVGTATDSTVAVNDSATLSFAVFVFSVTAIAVSPHGAAAWGSSVSIACGGVVNDASTADVRITIAPLPEGAFVASIPITVTGNAAAGASGASATPSHLVFEDGSLVDGPGEVSATITGATLLGTLRSSNKLGTCTVEALSQSSTVIFAWDAEEGSSGRWSYGGTFAYDAYDAISYRMQMPDGTPIAQHDVSFTVTEVSYMELDTSTWEWIDHPGVTEDLDYFARFADGADGTGDGIVQTASDGVATSYQIIFGTPNGDATLFTYEVLFTFTDLTVWN